MVKWPKSAEPTVLKLAEAEDFWIFANGIAGNGMDCLMNLINFHILSQSFLFLPDKHWHLGSCDSPRFQLRNQIAEVCIPVEDHKELKPGQCRRAAPWCWLSTSQITWQSTSEGKNETNMNSLKLENEESNRDSCIAYIRLNDDAMQWLHLEDQPGVRLLSTKGTIAWRSWRMEEPASRGPHIAWLQWHSIKIY
jgi:hypothetical protein